MDHDGAVSTRTNRVWSPTHLRGPYPIPFLQGNLNFRGPARARPPARGEPGSSRSPRLTPRLFELTIFAN